VNIRSPEKRPTRVIEDSQLRGEKARLKRTHSRRIGEEEKEIKEEGGKRHKLR